MIWERAAQLILVIGVIVQFESADKSQVKAPSSPEQSVFGVEDAKIVRPVSIPEGVLRILRKNEYVLTCLEEGQSPNEIPASWFVGSEIHLNGPHEIDLVVLANYGCLRGANIGPFWVFRKTTRGNELVLDVSVLDLKVLDTRSNGYRDIQTWSSTAVSRTTLLFRFDGQTYRESGRKEDPW